MEKPNQSCSPHALITKCSEQAGPECCPPLSGPSQLVHQVVHAHHTGQTHFVAAVNHKGLIVSGTQMFTACGQSYQGSKPLQGVSTVLKSASVHAVGEH